MSGELGARVDRRGNWAYLKKSSSNEDAAHPAPFVLAAIDLWTCHGTQNMNKNIIENPYL